MQSLRNRRSEVPSALNMKDIERLYPRVSFAEKRTSEPTDFYDTEFDVDEIEESGSASESTRRSDSESYGHESSNTTISTPDPPTPGKCERGASNSPGVKGPSGPHLFKESISSSVYSRSSAEIDLYFQKSPGFSQPLSGCSSCSQFSPRVFGTVQPDVSQVEEVEIRSWSPSHVAYWLSVAGFDDFVIDNFMMNDISGPILLSLHAPDLKEMGISSFGKRHELMKCIDNLRETMKKATTPVSRSTTTSSLSGSPTKKSYKYRVSPDGKVSLYKTYGKLGKNATPDEPVSIVGIEQVVPKPHKCSKGEKCRRYRNVQRQMRLLKAENPGVSFEPGVHVITKNTGNSEGAEDMLQCSPTVQPPEPAQSDAVGLAGSSQELSKEALNEIERADPQDGVQQFLNCSSNYYDLYTPPESAPPMMVSTAPPKEESVSYSPFQACQPTTHTNANLRSLPNLIIPGGSTKKEEQPTAQQTKKECGPPTKVQDYDPFSRHIQGELGDSYHQGTPFSEMDLSVAAILNDPSDRRKSYSVPPDMKYGSTRQPQQCQTTSLEDAPAVGVRPHYSVGFRPGHNLRPVEFPSNFNRSPRNPRFPGRVPSQFSSSLTPDFDISKTGWMKKRKPVRFLRHTWQDAHFTLKGTNLAMHKDEQEALRKSRALENIDVDEYAVACSPAANSSKLSAASKLSILGNGQNIGRSKDDSAFAFSLVPSGRDSGRKILFPGGKSHHFAVKSRDERIDWMRDLMLAKALKKGKENGGEMLMNGNAV